MIHGVTVVAVIPAYNEGHRIGAVLQRMPAHLDHVIVVDDGSTDDTASVARAVEDPRLEVHTQDNLGVGAAIAAGYRRALDITRDDAPAVFIVLAGDGQMHPADIDGVVEPIASGRCDYVKGERFSHPSVRTTMPATRYWAGRALSALTSRLVGQAIHDSQCGFTAISRRACARLDLARFWPSFGYPNAILAELSARGLRIGEVPVRPLYPHTKNKLRAFHLATVLYVLGRSSVLHGRAIRGVRRAQRA
jgi:glycosyltransferase involved in cell wall biosynthesis